MRVISQVRLFTWRRALGKGTLEQLSPTGV